MTHRRTIAAGRTAQKYLPVLLLALATLAPARASAESGWIGAHQIKALEHVSTYGWLRLAGIASHASGTECSNSYGFLIDNDDGGFDQRYRILLGAYLAGKSIKVKVAKDATSDTCRVTRVLLDTSF